MSDGPSASSPYGPRESAPCAGPTRTVEEVLTLCRRGTLANQATQGLAGCVVEVSETIAKDVLVAGDLHGHWENFNAILQTANLDENPQRHLVLQEVCHGGPEYSGGVCGSHAMLEAVIELKSRYANRVHFILSNHELAELTGHPIRKDGRMMLMSFLLGMNRRYGPRAAEVHAAYVAFIAACPLAVRIGRNVIVCHSAPARCDSLGFDSGVFNRRLEAGDLVQSGAAFELVWGRDFRVPNAQAFAEAVGARWLVHGHTPCDAGFTAPNDYQLIVDCSSRPAAAVLVPAAGVSSMEELLSGVVRLDEAVPQPNQKSKQTQESSSSSAASRGKVVVASPAASGKQHLRKERNLATISESLQEVMKIEGAMAAAIVDGTTGMCLGTASREEMDMEVAAAGDTEVFRSKLRALEQQGRAAVIEEITITLPKELHIIKTLARDRNLFLYLLLDRHGCNQALAMRKLANVERDLDV